MSPTIQRGLDVDGPDRRVVGVLTRDLKGDGVPALGAQVSGGSDHAASWQRTESSIKRKR